MLKMKWENLGKLNVNLPEKYHLHFRLNTLPNSTGCFVLPISTDSTALFLNFESKKYTVYNSKNNPKLFRFFHELPKNQQVYSDAYGLKILLTDSLINIDSLSWNEALENPTETDNLLEIEGPTVFLKYSILFAVIGLVAGLALLLYLFKKKKRTQQLLSEEPSQYSGVTLDLSIANTLVFEGAMYPVDPADYFVIRKLSEQDASTIDLNEWLGLENKQPENQKKQRAEWIKKMNTFFNSIGFKEDAFNRERLETDKRMFVYKMNSNLKGGA
jgi:hypothetical protein